MFIRMEDCITANGERPFKGVVQIGSHLGTEAKAYADAGVRNVLWIDANKDVMKPLYEHTRDFSFESKYFHAVLSDEDDQELTLKVMNESQYSSLLELGSSPLKDDLTVIERRQAITKRFETFVRKNIVEIDLDKYDFIKLDTQGMELKVLQGFGPLLKRFPFKAVYTEVSFEETYAGGCTHEELDRFLQKHGFTQTLLYQTGYGGEALYLRP